MGKILLDKFKAKLSRGAQNSVPLELSRDEALLPNDQVSDELNLFRLYCNEVNACNTYRMFFTVNPICSNVLFNPVTEVVVDEGSKDVKNLEYTSIPYAAFKNKPGNTAPQVTQLQAIRDTEYSSESIGKFVYHCGYDIFNNHVLRNNGYVFISPYSTGETFNTVGCRAFDNKGNKVMVKKPNLVQAGYKNVVDSVKEFQAHVYNHNNLLEFQESITENLTERDGWFGFINKSNVNIPNLSANGESVSINKVMNNNKACEFIDMYPDRSLYSFLPKYNKYRDRSERNWHYFLTYPYKNVYKPSENDTDFDLIDKDHGVKIVWSKSMANATTSKYGRSSGSYTVSRSDGQQVYLRSGIRHNLSEGDEIRLYYKNGINEEYKSCVTTVISIGDKIGGNKEYYFSVSYDDVCDDFGEYKLIKFDSVTVMNVPKYLYFKKLVDGTECDYYFRVFKKLTKSDGTQLHSNLNKLAFSRTIYNDQVAQILYTDNLVTEGILDNRGREINEVYLTIIKNNAGYKEWYLKKGESLSSENVEYSHCFGPVTEGLDLKYTEKEANETKNTSDGTVYTDALSDFLRDYNVHCIHNVDQELAVKQGLEIPEMPKTLSGRAINKNNKTFLGDIVEYCPTNDSETTIENVYHRFNTFQREYCETADTAYSQIRYDYLTYDDDDYITSDCIPAATDSFKTTLKRYNEDAERDNVFPEGYYYNPHHRIKLNELADNATTCQDFPIKYNSTPGYTVKEEGRYNVLSVKTTNSADTKYGCSLYVDSLNDNFIIDDTELSDGVITARALSDTEVGAKIVSLFEENGTDATLSLITSTLTETDITFSSDYYNVGYKYELASDVEKADSMVQKYAYSKRLREYVENNDGYYKRVEALVKNDGVVIPEYAKITPTASVDLGSAEFFVKQGENVYKYNNESTSVGEIVFKLNQSGSNVNLSEDFTICTIKTVTDKVDFIAKSSVSYNEDGLVIIEPTEEFTIFGDSVIVLLMEDGSYYEVSVDNSTDETISFVLPDGIENIRGAKLFRKNFNAPSYAYYMNDGSGIRIWKDTMQKTSVDGKSEVYDRMFSNGCLYVNTNINFYLRRQDPDGRYLLKYTDDNNPVMAELTLEGEKADVSAAEYEVNIDYTLCE